MWYCLDNDTTYGPFSDQEARQFIAAHPSCLVWKEGMTEWVKATRFNSFSNISNLPPISSYLVDSTLDFTIYGDDMQYVEMTLNPQENIISEPGAMIYKDYEIEFEALFGKTKSTGLFSKLFGAGRRVLTGESAFISSFLNASRSKTQRVAFAAPYPGKLIPISLKSFGGEIICQKDSFLCAQSDIDIGIFFQKRVFTAFFGGAGFIMQRLKGNGIVFIHAGGSISEIDLKSGESLQVDAGCLVAFQPSVSFDITSAGSFKSQIFGGTGFFFANLTGPGKIWIQSLPFSRFAKRLFSTHQASRTIKRVHQSSS